MKIRFDCDEKYFKNKDLLELLKVVDFSNLEKVPLISENRDGTFSMEFDNDELLEVKMAINDEILSQGLERQNKVNEIGRMLYWLYDEVLIQTRI